LAHCGFGLDFSFSITLFGGVTCMAQGKETAHDTHHITTKAVLTKTLWALVILTALTVGAARLHLGMFAAPVAFLIATAKAFLVMSFFMGLKYDDRSNRIIFSTGFIFLGILYFFTILDILTRILATNTL
jgi:cytochrome c oxidase subunit IV